jgi:hypothetical protein
MNTLLFLNPNTINILMTIDNALADICAVINSNNIHNIIKLLGV